MPVLRNVNPSRHSGRLEKQTPVIYDDEGWPTPESIKYIPNGGPLNESMSQYASLGSSHIPQSNHQYSHSRQQERKPYILPDGTLYYPSKISASSLAPPRERHSRRREPGHIPRPRNAFIIFRSSYVASCAATGDEQQNELSKQAGKVWNRMSEDEREPFIQQAKAEKIEHQEMYPNYVYCPGRGSARRKGTASTKRASELSAPSASPKVITPENPYAAPTFRPPRAAAQLAAQKFFLFHSISPSPSPVSPLPKDSPMQESLEVASPASNPLEIAGRTLKIQASEPDTSVEEDDFVPTADIPELELTPTKKEKPKHTFDLSMRPSYLDRVPEQFGFKYDNDSTFMLAHLPLLNLNDTISTGDMSPPCSRSPSPFSTTAIPDDISECLMTDDITDFWQSPTLSHQPSPDFPSCSRSSPANFSTSPYTPALFSTDSSVPDCYQQEPTNLATLPRQSVPGFTWSSEYDSEPVGDTMPKDDGEDSFMTSIFDFDSFKLG